MLFMPMVEYFVLVYSLIFFFVQTVIFQALSLAKSALLREGSSQASGTIRLSPECLEVTFLIKKSSQFF